MYRLFAIYAGILSLVIGCVVIVGWFLNIQIFKELLPGLATMKANTALSLMLLGGGLISLSPPLTEPRRRVGLVCAAAALVIGGLILVQQLLNVNIGIDQLIFQDVQTPDSDFPGRPSVSTALNIFLSAVALLLVGLRAVRWSHLPALLAAAVGLVAVLGYLYGVSSLYQVSPYNAMALHTAVAFVVLNIGILFAYPEVGLMRVFRDTGAGGVAARRLLPAAVLIPAVIGWLINLGLDVHQFDAYVALALFAVASIAIFTTVIWWNTRALIRSEKVRQRLESARDQADEQFKVIFDESLDVIMIVDGEDGNILHCNPAVEWTLGYPLDELVGKHFSLLFPADETSSRDELMKNIQTYGHIFLSQAFRRMDGSIALMDLTAQVIPWQSARAIMVTLRDVTERKRMEEEILKSELLRIELEKDRQYLNMKENFIAAVSHDFRTPLTVILTSNEILEKYYERLTTDRRKEQLGRIRQQVFYMKELLDDVLTLAEARVVKAKPGPIILDNFCKGLFEDVQLTNTGKHHFAFHAQGDFSNLELDEKLLQRILVNLLTNAVKYSPDGGDVRFELTRENGEVLFKISDQGKGIPPEKLGRLFEPFLRGANVADIPGTGLGMAIVYESVRACKGTIDVKSVVDEGTTISVRLPVEETQAVLS